MAQQQEDCKHCVPYWELNELNAHIKGGRGSRYSISIGYRACLTGLKCEEDFPSPMPFGPQALLDEDSIPDFGYYGTLSYSLGAPAMVGVLDVTPADTTIVRFRGEVDEKELKVCCKPNYLGGVDKCCIEKKKIICDCYFNNLPPNMYTSKDKANCCIRGQIDNAASYISDDGPDATTNINKSKRQIVSALNKELAGIAGGGAGPDKCTKKWIGNAGWVFHPPSPEPIGNGFDWSYHCPCYHINSITPPECPR